MKNIKKYIIPLGFVFLVGGLVYYDYQSNLPPEKIEEKLPKEEIVSVPISTSTILRQINQYREQPLEWDIAAAKVADVAAKYIGERQDFAGFNNGDFDLKEKMKNAGYERGTVKPVVVVNAPSVEKAVDFLNEKHPSLVRSNDIEYVGMDIWQDSTAEKFKTVFVFIMTSST